VDISADRIGLQQVPKISQNEIINSNKQN